MTRLTRHRAIARSRSHAAPPVGAPRGSLRLAIYAPSSSLGGSIAFVATLLRSLDAAVDVTVLGEHRVVLDVLAAARPTATVVCLPRIRNKSSLPSIVGQIRRLRELDPDVLHVNLDGPFVGQYGLLAGWRLGIPTVAVVHSHTPALTRLQAAMTRPLARRVDHYVAVCSYAARNISSELRLPPGRMDVIYNGVPEAPAPAPICTVGPPVIGFVGRLDGEKGPDLALSALARLPEGNLVFVGDGPERAQLESEAGHLGLADRVTFAGWLDAPWFERWAFDALVVPSRRDAFPLVVLEAMMAGVPVVATAIGGLPEAIDDGTSGMLVPPDDPEALASALASLLDNQGARQEMVSLAREEACRRFTAPQMAARYLDLYEAMRR